MATQQTNPSPEGALFEQPQPKQTEPFAALEPDAPEQKHEAVPLDKSLLDEALRETMRQDDTLRGQLASMRFKEAQMDFDCRLSNMLVNSGQLADLKGMTVKQAVATCMLKIEIGRSYGLPAGIALNVIVLVKGRPTLSAEFLAARMKQAGYSWKIEKHDNNGCTLLPMRGDAFLTEVARDNKGEPIYDKVEVEGKTLMTPRLVPAKVSFTMEDAKRAKLVKADGGYETYPMDMFFWRCISRMKRRYASEIGFDLPTTEELREDLSSDGPQRPNLPISNKPDGAFATDKVA